MVVVWRAGHRGGARRVARQKEDQKKQKEITRICDFPISKSKRCKQLVADDKPNCGRHNIDLSANQLGQNPTVYERAGELHVWAGEPDSVYCLIHSDPAYQAPYQVAGEKVPCCLRKGVTWRDYHGRLHREDGPAAIKADGTQRWYQHGKLHREDGPAIVDADGTREWWQNGEYHRDDGPAIIDADGEQEWYQWDELHRDDGPARTLPDGEQWWCQEGVLHRDDGPAVIEADGTQEWWWHGEQVTEEEHAELLEQSHSV